MKTTENALELEVDNLIKNESTKFFEEEKEKYSKSIKNILITLVISIIGIIIFSKDFNLYGVLIFSVFTLIKTFYLIKYININRECKKMLFSISNIE